MDSAQSRAARALLNWSQGDLVERSGVSKKTIADFELGLTRPHQRTMDALLGAFEDAGIEFILRGARIRSARKPKVARPSS